MSFSPFCFSVHKRGRASSELKLLSLLTYIILVSTFINITVSYQVSRHSTTWQNKKNDIKAYLLLVDFIYY